MRSTGLRWCAIAAAIVLATASCGDGDSTASSTPTRQQRAALEGVPWVLSNVTALVPAAAGASVTARFEAGTVSGDSGCNTYRAPYEASGSDLTIGPDIASTRIACPPIPTEVERTYLERLKKVERFAVKGSVLTLTDRSGATLLTYQASVGASALAGEWNVTSYYTGTAIQSVELGSTLTADFQKTSVSGNGGCNTFNGPYEVSRDTIKIGPLASTLRACGEPALDTQEQHYLAALELASTFTATSSRLDLFRADGGFAVTFERAGSNR